MSHIPKSSLATAGIAILTVAALSPSSYAVAATPGGALPSNHTHQDQPVLGPRAKPNFDNGHPDRIDDRIWQGYTTSTHTHQDDDPEDPSGAVVPFEIDISWPDDDDNVGDISFDDLPDTGLDVWHTVQESFWNPDLIDVFAVDTSSPDYSSLSMGPGVITLDFTPDDYVATNSLTNFDSPGTIPTPGALPLLLLSALAGGRRRRR